MSANSSFSPEWAQGNAVASPGTVLDIASAIEAGAGLGADGHDERTVAQGLFQQALLADQKGQQVKLQIPGLGDNGGPVCIDGDSLQKSLAANSLRPKPTPVRINHTLDALGEYTGIQDAASITGRTMAFLEATARTPAMQMILRTRANQARRFCRRPRFRGDIGFEIRMVSERKVLSASDARERDRIEDFVLHGGDRFDARGQLRRRSSDNQPGVWDGRQKVKAGGLQNMVAAMVTQSLSLDWAPVRMEPGADESAHPVAWFGNADVDAKQIRRAYEGKYTAQIDRSGMPIKFVELEPGIVSAGHSLIRREYPWNRMAVMVTNPRTDFYGLGYGFSVVEAALDVLASIFLNLKFRSEYFDNNHIPHAIVALRGQLSGFTDSSLSALRTQLASKVGGPGAFFRLLYLGLPADEKAGLEIHPLKASTGAVNEMEYAHQDYQNLMTLLCALAQIDPAEIGMKSDGGSSVLQEADPETRLEHSQDKGLIPLMEAIAAFINEHIVQFLNPDFEFAWVGLYPDSYLSDARAQARLALGDTPNEIKDAQDRPRDLHADDPVLWAKLSQKFATDAFDTPEEWRAKVNQAYEKEFAAKYGEDEEPWSSAWDVPAGNPEMMQIVLQRQQELAGAKAKQKQIADLIKQGHSPEEAKAMAEQQMQQQGAPDGADPNDAAPGDGSGQMSQEPPQSDGEGNEDDGENEGPSREGRGTASGLEDDRPFEWEHHERPKRGLNKAVGASRPSPAHEIERLVRILRVR